MQHVLVTIEAAFEVKEAATISDTILDALETLRGQGAAHVIASKTVDKDPFDTKEWREKTLHYITVNAPIDIEVD